MEPTDNPTGWVNAHITSYVTSGGEQGHRWRGLDTLLITTTGRSSGKLRRTALIYGEHDSAYVIVGSWGGSDRHPSWYLNLQADPNLTVQVGPEVFAARARTATGEERALLWKQMAAVFPTYDEYQAKTEREIPVVVLEPAA